MGWSRATQPDTPLGEREKQESKDIAKNVQSLQAPQATYQSLPLEHP